MANMVVVSVFRPILKACELDYMPKQCLPMLAGSGQAGACQFKVWASMG